MSTRRAISVYVDPENEHATREIVERAMHVNATFRYEVTAEPVPQDGEYAWMIERKSDVEDFSSAPLWFDGHRFSPDPNAGVRFARREDADKVISAFDLKWATATDHKWYKASTDAHAVE